MTMPVGDSFGPWYRRTHAQLFTAMLAVSGNREVASESTDEAFSRAWRDWERVRSMDSPEGWTYRVALNVLRTQGRRRRVEQRLLPRLAYRPAVPAPAGEVWELVRELPARQRTAVVLRFVADLDERHIAEVMHVTRGTVASTLAAARRALGAALEADSVVEERS
jgi:DNA-directed RNA polymerase specialized sigma24 family protein